MLNNPTPTASPGVLLSERQAIPVVRDEPDTLIDIPASQKLVNLLDALVDLGHHTSACLHEDQLPGAAATLTAWANARGVQAREQNFHSQENGKTYSNVLVDVGSVSIAIVRRVQS